MKNINILAFFFMCWGVALSLPSQAQDQSAAGKERYQNIQNAKIAFLTDKLSLTTEQAQKFWPLYNQLEDERQRLHEKLKALRLNNLEAMSEADLRVQLNNRFAWRQSELDLDKQYMDKFLKVLSVRQVATLYRSEREFTKVLLQKLDASQSARNSR